MREQIMELLNRRFYTDDDIRALGPEAVPPAIDLFSGLEGEHAESRRLALVHMLGVLNGDQAVAFLAGVLREARGRNETLEVAAAEALARTDRPAALDVVLPLLDTGEKRMRRNVLAGLGSSGRAEVLERVRLAATRDPDEAVREKAAESARSIEERTA